VIILHSKDIRPTAQPSLGETIEIEYKKFVGMFTGCQEP
jgi:hypothetical protein